MLFKKVTFWEKFKGIIIVVWNSQACRIGSCYTLTESKGTFNKLCRNSCYANINALTIRIDPWSCAWWANSKLQANIFWIWLDTVANIARYDNIIERDDSSSHTQLEEIRIKWYQKSSRKEFFYAWQCLRRVSIIH